MKKYQTRKYKMKTIIATAIALTIATSASASSTLTAGNATWGGTSGTVHGGDCAFTKNQPGVMEYNSTTGVWSTKTNAVVILKNKNGNNVYVTADENLRTSAGVIVSPVQVNYGSGTTVTVKGKSDATVNINDDDIAVGNLKRSNGKRTKLTFSLNGTATMPSFSDGSTNDLELDDDTQYKINHEVTCVQ